MLQRLNNPPDARAGNDRTMGPQPAQSSRHLTPESTASVPGFSAESIPRWLNLIVGATLLIALMISAIIAFEILMR